MKRLQLFSATAAFLSVGMLCSPDMAAGDNSLNAYKGKVDLSRIKQVEMERGAMKIQSADFEVRDSVVNGFSYYSTSQHPLHYEPITGILTTIKRGGIDGDLVYNRNNAFVRYSTDFGDTWSEPIGPVQEQGVGNQDSARYPSVYGAYTGSGSGPESMVFMHSLPFNNGGWGVFGQGLTFGDDVTSRFTISNDGLVIDGTRFSWSSGAKMTATPDGSTIITVVTMSPPTGSLPELNSGVGLLRFNYNEDAEPQAIAPPQWRTEKFADAAEANSRTSTISGLGWDASGVLYCGVFGRYEASEDPSTPVPAVSISTDEGRTWSEFEPLPHSVLNAHITAEGGNPDDANLAFTANDMVVTGPGKVSFICDLVDGADILPISQNVEVEYDNGTWTVRKISPATMLTWNFFHEEPNFDRSNFEASQTRTENQIAITADGRFLVAKWHDIITITVDAEEVQTSDIFMAVREMGSETWTPARNVTNSPLIDKITWIPNIVPSLENIPLLANQTILLASETTFADQQFAQRVVIRPQHIVTKNLDISDIIISVEGENPAAQISVNAPIPNPARTQTTLSFDLPSAGTATVEVFDAMGRRVATVADDFFPAGQNAITFDVSELSAGNYIYTLSFNGHKASQNLKVVR